MKSADETFGWIPLKLVIARVTRRAGRKLRIPLDWSRLGRTGHAPSVKSKCTITVALAGIEQPDAVRAWSLWSRDRDGTHPVGALWAS